MQFLDALHTDTLPAMTDGPRRQLYLAAIAILCGVILLLAFISVSTYRNLGRERDAVLETVRRQALTLINALEAGARAGMQPLMADPDVLDKLVQEIGRAEDIRYLYLANAAGRVMHHSIASLKGGRVLWRPAFVRAGDVHTRVKRLDDGTRVYEVARPFAPLPGRPQNMAAASPQPAAAAPTRLQAGAAVYLGMNLAAFEAARRADLQHAAIMTGIVLALGGGVIFFFFVIRSYYRINRILQKTRDYTRQVIASMAYGVLSIDLNGQLVSCNYQAKSLLAIPANAVERFDLRRVFDFEATGIDRTLDAGIPVMNHEIRFTRPLGDFLPLMLTVTPIRDEAGGQSGAVVVIRDMSAIKQLEEQVRRTEKLAAIGRLAAGVAHEIRNPLSSLRGFAYLLGKSCTERAPEREYAHVMVREIDRINRVVSDLLNFARPMTLELEKTPVAALIKHVVSLVSADAGAHNVNIHMDCSTDLPPIWIDPHQTTQALLNLMLNAVYAMENGGILNIRADVPDDGHQVTIAVEDSGPGIEPALQEKIFEPFYTTRERGTGLGLAMVRKIAENHDGSATAASPLPGKNSGAVFTLVLKNMAADTASATPGGVAAADRPPA